MQLLLRPPRTDCERTTADIAQVQTKWCLLCACVYASERVCVCVRSILTFVWQMGLCFSLRLLHSLDHFCVCMLCFDLCSSLFGMSTFGCTWMCVFISLCACARERVCVCAHQSVSTCSIRVSVHTNAIYSSCNLHGDPGTTWVPFALWTLKDRSIRLNGFLHLKQHSWSLGGTLVRLFLLFRCGECGLCAALSGNKGWKLLC